MRGDHEQYDAISRVRRQFWRRYLSALVVPILALMLAGRHWLFLGLFVSGVGAALIYTRWLLFHLAKSAGFEPREAALWVAASFLLTGFAVAIFVLERPLRRMQRRISARALFACPECHADVWEGQTDCMRCGVPVGGTGLPYYDA